MTEKNIIVVGENNYFKTISEALQVASEQTKIQVMPGFYYESLVIDKNVTIIGVGKAEQIVIIGSIKSAISSTAKKARIQNVTLKQKSNKKPCVDISNGGIHIEGCDISGGKNCVVIYGAQSAPILKNNRIHHAKYKKNKESGHGILIYKNAKGRFEGNSSFENESSGILLQSGSMPVVCNNQSYKNKNDGIVINNSKGIFEQNKSFENEWSGIWVGFGSNPIVHNNQSYKNKGDGILIYESKGTFEQNESFENGYSGISVQSNSDPRVCNNRIYKNKGDGILIYKSKGTFEQNDVYENKK